MGLRSLCEPRLIPWVCVCVCVCVCVHKHHRYRLIFCLIIYSWDEPQETFYRQFLWSDLRFVVCIFFFFWFSLLSVFPVNKCPLVGRSAKPLEFNSFLTTDRLQCFTQRGFDGHHYGLRLSSKLCVIGWKCETTGGITLSQHSCDATG